jgi:O-antigen/teichoic acid export membrane protein
LFKFFTCLDTVLSTFEHLIERKGNLFIISVFAAIGIMLLPVILPNLFHGFHIAHIGLHIAGLALAIFLTISTLYAYVKIKTKRLAIAAIAFSMFIGAEVFSIIEVTWPFTFYLDRITMLEISHLLIIGMLGIFSIGVFRRD